MESTQTISLVAAAVTGLGAVLLVAKVAWNAVSKPITVKRKDSGKTVTLSRDHSTSNLRKLLELAH